MSYKLQKPITDKQRADFIVEYNHNQGLKIEDGTDTYTDDDLTLKGDFIFALEPNEIIAEEEVEIDVPDKVEEEQNQEQEEEQEQEQEQTYHKEIVIVHRPIINPNWDEEQSEKREANFKSKFFEIQGFGWYRKQPKGYTSAVESLNTAFNAVTIMQQLPANMLIFYQAPDFTKPEECTEEWLIEHQMFNQVMTAQEFGVFYVGFMTAWNNQEHVHEVENADTTDNEQTTT